MLLYSAQNRESAKKSRIRKKFKTDQLQKSLQNLKKENEKLRTYVYSKLGAEKAGDLIQEATVASFASMCVPTANDKFITALKNPLNRIVYGSSLDFLHKLRENIEL
jgi:hypothetical protein